MEYVRLGDTSLKVSTVGLGCWQFGAREWGWGREYGKAQAIATINRALELGINLIDTAELYGWGVSEQIIGEAIRGRRDDVVIATKVSAWHLRYSQVLKAAERSLRRLGVKTIDLYQVHFPNPLIPIKSTMRAMEHLVRDGKIRYIGVSNFGVKRLRAVQEALASSEIASDQVKYNMLQRRVEDSLIPYAEKEGISIIAYSPLAQGLLTGKYGPNNPPPRGARSFNTLFSARNLRSAAPIIEALSTIARKRGKSIGQVAINWLLMSPSVVAIPGAKNPAQIEENAGAAGWGLTTDEMSIIGEVLKGYRQERLVSLLGIPLRLMR